MEPTQLNSEQPVQPTVSRQNLTPDDIIREIVRYWWAKRKWIGKIVVIAAVVCAVILLLVPNRYCAEAKVIILPPKFSAEIRTEPLSVITAKELLKSGEMVESLIRTIREAKPLAEKFVKQYDNARRAAEVLHALGREGIAKKLGEKSAALAPFFDRWGAEELQALAELPNSEIEDWTIEVLGKSLDCEEIIEKKTAADIKMSPLLNLYAVANSGLKAQLLVNTWAILFEKKYDELANEKTRYQYDYILAQQQDAEKELAKQQQRIVDFKAKNNLELLLREIDEYSADYKEFLNQLVQKRHQVAILRQKIEEQKATLATLTKDGFWIGELEAEQIMKPEVAEAESKSADVFTTHSETPYDEARLRTLELRSRLLHYLARLGRFQQEQPVELINKELDQLQSDYFSAIGKLRSADARVAILRGALAALDAALSSTERIIVLFKDVPDVNISEALRTNQPQQLKALAGVQFRREELNPAWTILFEQRAKLEAEYHQAQAELAELQPRVKQYEEQARALQIRAYRARLAERMLLDSLEARKKSLQALLQQYLDTRNQVHDDSIRLGLLLGDIRELEEQTSRTKAMVEQLQRRYNEASAQLQLMEIQLRAVQRNADLLTQKLQDARMAIAQPVSDVSIAAFAPTPTKHYFPPRTITLIGLTFVTLLTLLTLLGRSRYVELQRR
ncbi:MAG: hypothetical protein ACPL7D_04690 [Candidatus Sumerlaeaceae bacterium]